MLFSKSLHLLGLQTGEGEHANLAGDVGPIVLAAEGLEVLAQEGAHLDDAVGHALDLTEPLLVQSGVIHDGRGDAGAVDGRVGVEGADENLDLRLDALLLLGALADEREGTDTLSIETLEVLLVTAAIRLASLVVIGHLPTHHVLGKGLAQSNVVALLDEVTGSKSILVSVTAGEALVGHVEEGEVALLLHDIADLAPLVLGGVNTGRVVGTGVQQNDTVLGSSLDVGNQTLEVQANGVLVVVAVLLDLKAGVLENGVVVGPAGVGKVDLLRVGVEALQESTTNSQGTGSRDGLGDDEAVLLQDGGVGAVGKLSGGLGEGRDTGDASVLLVAARGHDLVLGGADGGQNVRLTRVVTYTTAIQLVSSLGRFLKFFLHLFELYVR